ncbi:MAG: hypothetical protein TREMPRED_000993 [Tremellales sp. Tagirdzhanova-0007]|nr:MAG: hypothetical protein TREMPRED_000993 [Tremellales sp. Tagirdzhanova-0007]
MFPTAKRTFLFLLRTPLIPPPPPPPTYELITLSHSSAGPSRPRAASRAFSSLPVYSHGYVYGNENGVTDQVRGYASDTGKKELYSDEAGSSGAGTDDVAHTKAAFDSNPDPSSASKDVEKETGKDFTNRSPANPGQSQPPGVQGEKGTDAPLRTSRKEAGRD